MTEYQCAKCKKMLPLSSMGLRVSGRHKYVQSWCTACRTAAVYAGRAESRGPMAHISEPAFYKNAKDVKAPTTIKMQNGSEFVTASTNGGTGRGTLITPISEGSTEGFIASIDRDLTSTIDNESIEYIRQVYYGGCKDSCKTRSRNFMITRLKARWAKGKW